MLRLARPVIAAIVTLAAFAGQTKQAASPPAQDKAEYAGTELCATCHEDLAKSFDRGVHQRIGTTAKYGRQEQACEACHGPGSKHIEAADATGILNPKKMRGQQADAACLACHRNQSTQHGRVMSSHARGGAACTSCHVIHGGTAAADGSLTYPKQPPVAPKRHQDVNAQCGSCHISQRAQFQRPHAHRIPQNAMSCIDCHNPHGTFTARDMTAQASGVPGCVSCHADKRGPFTYEHAPMRMETCTTCHESHGSANPRMLTRAEVKFVCLECHANTPSLAARPGPFQGTVPPSFHDLRSPRYRNCTVCHQKIHGSHVDRNFLR